MKILFAVDLSEPSSVTRAVERMAQRMDAELLVLHVMSPAPVTSPPSLDPMSGLGGFAPYTLYDPELEENAAQAEEHALNAFLVDRFDRPIRAALRRGSPARTILKDAAEHEVDLIVLGKRHHSRLERLLVGSVASDVLKYTQCPTLVMPIAAEEH